MTEPIEQAQGDTEESQEAQGITLSEADLPPELQGRSPEEVKMFVRSLPGIVAQIKEENDTLRGNAQPTSQDTLPHGAPQDALREEEVDLAELMKTDPEAAMTKFIEQRYGPVLQQLDERVGVSDLGRMRTSLPDFHEYEEDVVNIIRANNLPMNEKTIQQAYTFAVGQRTLQGNIEERKRLEAESSRTLESTESTEKIEPLTELEQTIAASMRLTPEEYRKYADRDSTTLRAPGL